jgi:Fe-S cluster biogenesis protein NfuA/nitrite reductase/ring-hydroxylating ferredoxin subunit
MSHPNGASPEPSTEDELSRAGRRMQELVEKIQAMPDPASRGMLQDCFESVLHFYGLGLAQILKVIDKTGNEGEKVRAALLKDGGVTGLLLIHGLHPVPLETRLKEALEKVRPYMKSHGGDVELLSLENDFALLRLQGHCETCPSSTVTLELAVRHAIEEACPDLAGFEVEGMAKNGAAPTAGAHQFEHIPNSPPQWLEVPGAVALADGGMLTLHEGNEPLILCKLGSEFYAYYDRCPGCNMPLHLGKIENGTLTCHLGHTYDVRHAGRGLDGNSLHLEPLPLLVQNGAVKVALAPAPANGKGVPAESLA